MTRQIIIDGEEAFSLEDACKKLDIGIATLYVWLKRGRAKAIKEGAHQYIPATEVERLKREMF